MPLPLEEEGDQTSMGARLNVPTADTGPALTSPRTLTSIAPTAVRGSGADDIPADSPVNSYTDGTPNVLGAYKVGVRME